MYKFRGTIQQLKQMIEELKVGGIWLEKSNFWQFKTIDANFNFYPTTGTILFQGKHSEKLQLEQFMNPPPTNWRSIMIKRRRRSDIIKAKIRALQSRSA